MAKIHSKALARFCLVIVHMLLFSCSEYPQPSRQENNDFHFKIHVLNQSSKNAGDQVDTSGVFQAYHGSSCTLSIWTNYQELLDISDSIVFYTSASEKTFSADTLVLNLNFSGEEFVYLRIVDLLGQSREDTLRVISNYPPILDTSSLQPTPQTADFPFQSAQGLVFNWLFHEYDPGDYVNTDFFLSRDSTFPEDSTFSVQLPQTNVYYYPEDLNADTRYWWKIKVTDRYGETDSIQTWFTTAAEVEGLEYTSIFVHLPDSMEASALTASIQSNYSESVSRHAESDTESDSLALFRIPAISDASLLVYIYGETTTGLHYALADSVGISTQSGVSTTHPDTLQLQWMGKQ